MNGLRGRRPLPRAVREPVPPRPAGEVPRLGARRALDGREPDHADGRLPARLRRRLKAQFSTSATTRSSCSRGLAVWTFFAAALQSATRSMLDNANLIRKMRFPRQLVPLSVVGRAARQLRGDARAAARGQLRRASRACARRSGSRSRWPRSFVGLVGRARARCSRRSTCSSATSSSSSRRCSCRGSS